MSMSLAVALQAAMHVPSRKPATAGGTAAALTQRHLDDMTDACGVPHAWLTLRAGEVVLDPRPRAGAAKIQCVIGKVYPMLGKRHLAVIGNDQLSEDK